MINPTEFCLVAILLSVLLSLGSNRLMALVHIMALQGFFVSLVPLLLKGEETLTTGSVLFFVVMVLVKSIAIPTLLYVAVNRVAMKREVEPFIGYHASIVFGLLFLLLSVFITNRLRFLLPEGQAVVLIAAITTLAAGLFLMMGRKKAITQVIGYLTLENGIYLVGNALTQHKQTTLYIVEFGVLLDVLVAVMVMGIILMNINSAFDDVDTTLLRQLKD